MFSNVYDSGKRKFRLYVKITCSAEKKFRVFAETYGKVFSKYADRDIVVKGDRTIFLSFPVSPEKLFIGVVNAENPQDKDFQVLLIEASLPTYNIHIDSQAQRFLEMAIPFCQTCGFLSLPESGKVYKNDEFTIKYVPIIQQNGEALNTPARVGHATGTIEVSRAKFTSYTVPMRLIILLHEYGHKFANPKHGWEISDETGADLNALYLYLGMGWSSIDAIVVFAKVFYKAPSDSNRSRMRVIMDYIDRFQKEEFAQKIG